MLLKVPFVLNSTNEKREKCLCSWIQIDVDSVCTNYGMIISFAVYNWLFQVRISSQFQVSILFLNNVIKTNSKNCLKLNITNYKITIRSCWYLVLVIVPIVHENHRHDETIPSWLAERRRAGRFMYLCVVCLRQRVHILVPGSLMLCDVASEAHNDFSVEAFHVPFGRGDMHLSWSVWFLRVRSRLQPVSKPISVCHRSVGSLEYCMRWPMCQQILFQRSSLILWRPV